MAANPIYTGFFDLLVDKTSPEEILNYRLPEDHQEHIEDLIAKEKEEGLTPEESQEVNDFLELAHIILMVKGRAAERMRRIGA